MAYGQWKIDEELTFKEFGYYSVTLTKGSQYPVKCICLNCGTTANKRLRESNRKHRCKSIINGEKKCFKCKSFKITDEFARNKSTFDGFAKVCKECFKNYDATKKHYANKIFKNKTDLLFNFKTRMSYFKLKSKMKNLEFNIDEHYLMDLYKKQNGKCYFSGIDIKHNKDFLNYDSISIERLNPDMGYTKGNVVLSCFSLNSFKGMMTEREFKDFLKIILPELIKYSND